MAADDKKLFKKLMPKSNKQYLMAAFAVVFAIAFLAVVSRAVFPKHKNNNDIIARYYIGPVIKISQCRSCHRSIDAFNNPNLKFKHWIHFNKGIRCQICHLQPAHINGKTSLPLMSTCFSCHGLQHSKQGQVASGECETCHPPGFNRVPGDHTAEFRSSTHKNITKVQLGNCMICHEVSQCRPCHDSRNVKSNYDDYVFRVKLPPVAKPKLQVITFRKIVTLAQCRPCHTDLNANRPPGLIFNHWIHFSRGLRCTTCHKAPVHSINGTKRPPMELCFGCHGLKHYGKGQVATGDCSKCHPAWFYKKLPPSHKSNWLKGHKFEVKKNVAYTKHKTITTITNLFCFNCHEQKFCQNCHFDKLKHKPAGYLKPELRKTRHEKAHYQKDKLCDVCHDRQTFCKKCHPVTMPHPYTWRGQHNLELKSGKITRQVCFTCHDYKSFCQTCHHDRIFSKGEYLVSTKTHPQNKVRLFNNCAECHPRVKYNLSQSTLSKKGNDALVFHKAHFSQKWFPCKGCHSWREIKEEFGVSYMGAFTLKGNKWKQENIQNVAGLCYGCHNKEQFCTKCHKLSMPHPNNWKKMHPDVARNVIGIDKAKKVVCVKCHTVSANPCTSCHHQKFIEIIGNPKKGKWYSETPGESLHPVAIRQTGKGLCFQCHDALFCASCHIKHLARMLHF